MTYRELLYKATRLINKNEITLGEYEEMTRPLNREVEQEPILDKIRAEIIKHEADCRLSVDEYPSCKECTDNTFETIYGIIDKYRESEG